MSLRLVTFGFLFVVLVFTGKSQNLADTTRARIAYIKADSFLMQSNYSKAIAMFAEARKLYAGLGRWDVVARCYNKQCEINWRTSRFDEAKALADSAIDICQKKLGGKDVRMVHSYGNLAIIEAINGRYKTAVKLFQKGEALLNVINDKRYEADRAATYNGLGNIYHRMGDYSKAIDYFERSLEIYKQKFGADSWLLAVPSMNIGNLYVTRGNTLKAEEYYLRGMDIMVKNNKKGPDLASCYIGLGDIAANKGAYDLALSYYHKGMNVLQQTLAQDDHQFSTVYNSIGMLYASLGNYPQSLHYLEKELALMKKYFGGDDRRVAVSYRNLSSIYFQMGDLERALSYAEISISMAEKLFGKLNQNLPFYYLSICDPLVALKKSDLALEYIQKILAINENFKASQNEYLASAYLKGGIIYNDKNDIHQALTYFQKSLIANIENYQDTNVKHLPPLRGYASQNMLLETLNARGETFKHQFKTSHRTEDLHMALNNFQLADSLIDQVSMMNLSFNDRVELGNMSVKTFEGALETCFLLYQATKETDYLHTAFNFSEKSKSSALFRGLVDQSAKTSGLIPDDLLMLERKLKTDKSYVLTKIQAARTTQQARELDSLNNLSFDMDQRLDSLIQIYEQRYPRYHQMKYQRKAIAVNTLQEELQPGTAILEFFDAKSEWILFVISRHTFDAIKIPKDSDVQKSLVTFISCFDSKNLKASQSEDGFNKLNTSAFRLYAALLKKPLAALKSEQISNITIIPAGDLSYIPFELLLTSDAPVTVGQYSGLPYLLKDYAIGYGYSATLNFSGKKTRKSSGITCLAFAPSYMNDLHSDDSISTTLLGQFRDAEVPLKWNQHEVEVLSAKTETKYYLSDDATERKFKEEAAAYDIIHLAMHALVDEQNPMNSKLIFAQNKDSLEDNFLHAFELYNMRLNSKLAILSACNTGFGKLAQGEGLLSLGRAFSYAGVPAIVMSHWQVDDEATSKLMEFFYEGLANGLTKSEALRQAKLHYMKEASPLASHPFYWGSFIVVGDDSSLVSNYTYWIVLSVIVAGVVLVFIWFRISKRKSQTKHVVEEPPGTLSR